MQAQPVTDVLQWLTLADDIENNIVGTYETMRFSPAAARVLSCVQRTDRKREALQKCWVSRFGTIFLILGTREDSRTNFGVRKINGNPLVSF